MYNWVIWGLWAIFQANALSRPPEPTIRIFILQRYFFYLYLPYCDHTKLSYSDHIKLWYNGLTSFSCSMDGVLRRCAVSTCPGCPRDRRGAGQAGELCQRIPPGKSVPASRQALLYRGRRYLV